MADWRDEFEYEYEERRNLGAQEREEHELDAAIALSLRPSTPMPTPMSVVTVEAPRPMSSVQPLKSSVPTPRLVGASPSASSRPLPDPKRAREHVRRPDFEAESPVSRPSAPAASSLPPSSSAAPRYHYELGDDDPDDPYFVDQTRFENPNLTDVFTNYNMYRFTGWEPQLRYVSFNDMNRTKAGALHATVKYALFVKSDADVRGMRDSATGPERPDWAEEARRLCMIGQREFGGVLFTYAGNYTFKAIAEGTRNYPYELRYLPNNHGVEVYSGGYLIGRVTGNYTFVQYVSTRFVSS